MSTSKVAPPKRPKPMSQDELTRCARASGLPEIELRRIVGMPSMGKHREARPHEFTMMQARGVRMMAVNPEIRRKVLDLRQHFPRATITAIREW